VGEAILARPERVISLMVGMNGEGESPRGRRSRTDLFLDRSR